MIPIRSDRGVRGSTLRKGDRVRQLKPYQLWPTRMQTGFVGRRGLLVDIVYEDDDDPGPPLVHALVVLWDEKTENEMGVPPYAVEPLGLIEQLGELVDAPE
jgi:hypothetical protein